MAACSQFNGNPNFWHEKAIKNKRSVHYGNLFTIYTFQVNGYYDWFAIKTTNVFAKDDKESL